MMEKPVDDREWYWCDRQERWKVVHAVDVATGKYLGMIPAEEAEFFAENAPPPHGDYVYDFDMDMWVKLYEDFERKQKEVRKYICDGPAHPDKQALLKMLANSISSTECQLIFWAYKTAVEGAGYPDASPLFHPDPR